MIENDDESKQEITPEEDEPKKPKRDEEIERDFGPDSGHENDFSEPEECETEGETTKVEP